MSQTSAIFAGSGSLLIECANAYLQAGHCIKSVVTSHPAIARWAHIHGIAVLRNEAPASPELAARLEALEFDYLFIIGRPVLHQELAAQARVSALQFIDSSGEAGSTWQSPAWSLVANRSTHPVGWLASDRQQTGKLVQSTLLKLSEAETALSLQARCWEAGLAGFKGLIKQLAGGHPPLKGLTASERMASVQARPDLVAALDFSLTAAALESRFRALDFGACPNPVATTKIFLGDHLLRVSSVCAVQSGADASPGTVLQASEDTLLVMTAKDAVLLSGCTHPWTGAAGHGLIEGMQLPAMSGQTRSALAARMPALAEHEGHWRQVFKSLTPVELPYPHSTEQALTQSALSTRLPVTLNARPDGACTAAAFFAWLSTLTGQQRISLLYSDSELSREAEGLTCWMSPWVPLTLQMLDERCAERASQQAAAAIDKVHAAGPCARDLPARLGATSPLAEGWSQVGISLGGACASEGTALLLYTTPDGNALVLEADTRIFSAQTLTAMASHLELYLQQFRGDAVPAAIALIPPAEAAVFAAVNATALAYDAASSIQGVITRQAVQRADHAAVCFQGRTLSYRQLNEQASLLARQLRSRGVGQGQTIGLCVERGLNLVVGLLGILKAGAAYLPLDPEYPADRLSFMVEDSQAAWVLTSTASAPLLSLSPDRILLLEELSSEPDLMSTAAIDLEQETGRRGAYLMYTSGSTGQPKGVMVTQQNVLNLLAGLNARIPHAPPGRWLAIGSLSFDISVPELLWTLSLGFTVVIHSRAVRDTVAQALSKNAITHLLCTPSMASMLVSDPEGRLALSGLSVLMVGGEALPLALAKELRSLVCRGSVFNIYGPTETTVMSTVCNLSQMTEVVHLGEPIANTQIRVRTPGGQEAPSLVAGELLIAGAGVSDGYWRRPELTAERFIEPADQPAARFYRTGDLVRRHPDGALEYLGRMDHQVKIRGHRIELGEIENAIRQHDGVNEVLVMAIEEASGDWALAAFITPEAGAVLDTAQVRNRIAETLTPIMVPRSWTVLNAFPLTPNGKIDRRVLTLRHQAAINPLEPSANGLEKAVTRIWEEALGLTGVMTGDDFFALGGSFSIALRVQARLLDAFGHLIALPELVRHPTVRQLAAHLSAAHGVSSVASAAVPVLSAGAASGLQKPPLSEEETSMAVLWRELLGVSQVGPDDDFFALGGHSLTAVRLFAKIRNQFGVDLPLATLFQASSLAGFSALIEQSRNSLETQTASRTDAVASADAAHGWQASQPPHRAAWSPLVTICAGRAGRRPLFCVHGAGGNVLDFKPVSMRLGPEQPVYGLQAQGVDGRLEPLKTIEAMAAQYVAAIRTVEPNGPYQLVGHCAGGVIAFEMAQQLQQAGAEVSLLGLLNSLCPNEWKRKTSFLRKLWLMRHRPLLFNLRRFKPDSEGQRQAMGYEQALEKLAAGENLTPEFVEFHLYRTYLEAQSNYQVAPYSGTVTVFRATRLADMRSLAAGSQLGWNAFVSGNIEVHDMMTTHKAMLHEPNLSPLVQTLQKHLCDDDMRVETPACRAPAGAAASVSTKPATTSVVATTIAALMGLGMYCFTGCASTADSKSTPAAHTVRSAAQPVPTSGIPLVKK